MKRLPSILCYLLLAMSVGGPVCAQTPSDRDEQMINASLRFIKEKATLTKKEYQKFAKIYSEYNEELAKLNRELKPDNQDYMKRWSSINNEYNNKLEKELADTTRRKIGMAQWELSQKIFEQFSQQNRQEMDVQTQMWMRSAQINHPFMMMQPQVMDARRRQMENMEQLSEQQRQWRENFRKNWHLPDSIVSDSIRALMQSRFQNGRPGGFPGQNQNFQRPQGRIQGRPQGVPPYGVHGFGQRPVPGQNNQSQQDGPAFNPMFHRMPFGGPQQSGPGFPVPTQDSKSQK